MHGDLMQLYSDLIYDVIDRSDDVDHDVNDDIDRILVYVFYAWLSDWIVVTVVQHKACRDSAI